MKYDSFGNELKEDQPLQRRELKTIPIKVFVYLKI